MTSQLRAEGGFGVELFGQSGWHGKLISRWGKMADALLRAPSPFVTAAMPDEAAQTAAYRQLRANRLSVEDVGKAICDATARSSASERRIVIPIDGSSIAVRDKDGRKGAGAQGTGAFESFGYKVMTAVALTMAGIPIGLIGLFWWTRPRTVRERTAAQKKDERRRKSIMQKESGHWFRLLDTIRERLREFAGDCEAWFQMDRGADIAELLWHIVQNKVLATIRLAHERRVVDRRHRTQLDCVRTTRPVGEYSLHVPAARNRAERKARMVVRASKVTIRVPQSKRVVTVNVVHTREVGTVPRGEKRLEWFLYTTAPIDTFEQCCEVIRTYAMRWGIEEFHNSWKSGCTQVERTLLRSKTAILKWATLLAAVSIRALRLAKLSRESPDLPATTEFSRHEIAAAILLRKPKGIPLDYEPTMVQMVRWVGDLGGYAGSRAKYPPGKVVILRGLLKLEPAALALEQQERLRK